MAAPRLTISPIGFGAFKIGRNEKIKYPSAFDLPSDEDAAKLLNDVLDMGITHVDTAPAYGLSEQRIGDAIAHRRDEFILSTKVGETFTEGHSHYAFDAQSVRTSIETSLRHLKTAAVDILFIHAHRDDQAILNETEIVETVVRLRDAGKARLIGFSGYTETAFASSLQWADAIMVEYHMDDRSRENVISTAAQRDIAVIVKKGLSAGHLDPDEAIAFVLDNPNVTSLLIGSLNSDHLRANINVAKRVRPGTFDAT